MSRAIVAAVVVAWGTAGSSAEETPDPSLWQVQTQASPIAVLLFTNHTGTSRAVESVMPRVYEELDQRGAAYRSHAELRPVLRKHRIRSFGGVTAEEARAIQEETGAGLVLMGTLDLFEADGFLEVGVSARLVTIDDMRVVAAESAAATSEDYAGLFGIGRPTSPEEVAGRVVPRLFDGLERALAAEARGEARPATFVIVPFVSTMAPRPAGAVVSNIVISELVQRGFEVVETGLVRGLLLENRTVLLGEIDLPMLDQVSAAFDVDFVITGEVEMFQVARGVVEHANPVLDFGARLIDARGQRLLLTLDDDRSGRDGELILGIGRTHSLGRLTRSRVARLAEEIDRRIPENFASAGSGEETP